MEFLLSKQIINKLLNIIHYNYKKDKDNKQQQH